MGRGGGGHPGDLGFRHSFTSGWQFLAPLSLSFLIYEGEVLLLAGRACSVFMGSEEKLPGGARAGRANEHSVRCGRGSCQSCWHPYIFPALDAISYQSQDLPRSGSALPCMYASFLKCFKSG